MSKLYKLTFITITYIYIYSLMWIVDVVMNIGMFLYKLPTRYTTGKINMKLFKFIQRTGTEAQKDKFLTQTYQYAFDPFLGKLNWNCRILFLHCMLNFRGDCDDISTMAHMMFGDGKKYTILPYEKQYWKWMHVVYVRNGKVYSGSSNLNLQVYEMSLEQYVERYYTNMGIETFVTRLF